MISKDISSELKGRINAYVQYVNLDRNIVDAEEYEEILGNLPKNLKTELVYESYAKVFEQNQFLVETFSAETLRQSGEVVEEIALIPGDKLFTDDQEDWCAIYYLA